MIRDNGGNILESGTKENYLDPVGIRVGEWELQGVSACLFRNQETEADAEAVVRHRGVH